MWSTVSMHCSTRRRRASSILLAAFGVAYPFIVLGAIDVVSPVVFVVLALAALGLRLAWSKGDPGGGIFSAPFLAVGAGLLALLFYDGMAAAKAYPILMSLAFAALFGWSLVSPPTLIERFAAITGAIPTEPARRYMRRLTAVWFVFLLANAATSWWTALAGDVAVWTLYNGFLSYLLIGAMLGIELVIRRWVRRRTKGWAG